MVMFHKVKLPNLVVGIAKFLSTFELHLTVEAELYNLRPNASSFKS